LMKFADRKTLNELLLLFSKNPRGADVRKRKSTYFNNFMNTFGLGESPESFELWLVAVEACDPSNLHDFFKTAEKKLSNPKSFFTQLVKHKNANGENIFDCARKSRHFEVREFFTDLIGFAVPIGRN
jgi:hypothetical protein